MLGIFSAFTLPYVLGPASPEMMGPFMQRTFSDNNDADQRHHPGGREFCLLHRVRALLRPLRRQEPGKELTWRRPPPFVSRSTGPASSLPLVLTFVIVFPLVVVGMWAFTEVWRYPAIIPQQFGLKFWFQTLARSDVWEALEQA